MACKYLTLVEIKYNYKNYARTQIVIWTKNTRCVGVDPTYAMDFSQTYAVFKHNYIN